MLEGTKHEKAILVILAYIIGLTSGFIGFGINELHHSGVNKVMSGSGMMMEFNHEQSAPVMGAQSESGYNPSNGESLEEAVVYEDGQLTAVTKEGSMVLSVHIDQLGETIPDMLSTQGHHTQPPVYLVSPEGKYVYFCEQHLGADECMNLLFDAEEVSIKYVQVDDAKFMIPAAQAAAAYWSVDGLHINGFSSASADTPWDLVKSVE